MHKFHMLMSNTASPRRRDVLKGAISLATLAAIAGPRSAMAAPMGFDPYAAPVNVGPSSVTTPEVGATAAAPGTPYLVPSAPGWSVTSLMTAGNEVGGFAMAGIPDGLGALDNGDRTITILMNQEIPGGQGIARKYGGKGAFVSRWVLNKDTLAMVSGGEFLLSPEKLHLWTGSAWKTASQEKTSRINLTRLCSADLAPHAATFNAATGKGYNGRIFTNGEEDKTNLNRAFGWVAETGEAYELGAFSFGTVGDDASPPPSWENLLANPATGDQTVVCAISDGGTNQVYVYIGTKSTEGNPVEKAGLTNGKLYSLLIPDLPAEQRDTNIGLKTSIAGKGEGKRVGLAAPNKGTSFLRPEDGAWDTRNPNRFFFVTTDRNNFAADESVRLDQVRSQVGRSRLWAITFDDVTKIATDGTPTAKLEMLLDGTEGVDMLDNMTVDAKGIVYMCEDTGTSRHAGKMWAYESDTGLLTAFMKFDPEKFGSVKDGTYASPVKPFIDDNETTGVLDVTALFADAAWYRKGSTLLLVNVQAHFKYDTAAPRGAELVEGGQLLLLAKAP